MKMTSEEADKYLYLIYLHIMKKYWFLGHVIMHPLRRWVQTFYNIEDRSKFQLYSIYAILKLRSSEFVDVYIEKIDENDDMTWTEYLKINDKGKQELESFLKEAPKELVELITYIP